MELLIAATINVAANEDVRWQKQGRTNHSLLLMLFVFRLVVTPQKQDRHMTIRKLWEQCESTEIVLPQPDPPDISIFCDVREKLDKDVFRHLNREIIPHLSEEILWKDHRLFAINGSKINLPKSLIQFALLQ